LGDTNLSRDTNNTTGHTKDMTRGNLFFKLKKKTNMWHAVNGVNNIFWKDLIEIFFQNLGRN